MPVRDTQTSGPFASLRWPCGFAELPLGALASVIRYRYSTSIFRGPHAAMRMELQTSTCDLVERFKRGEQRAFSLLFGKYRRRLAVLLHYRMSEDLRGRLEVDDILQEVFLAAAQGLGRFDYQSPGSFMAWLSRIADHAIVDAARYENRQKRRAQEMW